MREPDSDGEWELETAAFNAANSPDVPEWAQQIIRDLWKEVCDRDPNIIKDQL